MNKFWLAAVIAVPALMVSTAASATAPGSPQLPPPEGLAGTEVSASSTGVLDFDGDGKTDNVVVRNTGGGPSGQITWFVDGSATPGNGFVSFPWGLASDEFLAGDYDGDGLTDAAVWRPGAAGVAAFWVRLSGGGVIYDVMGQNGDDPSVVGDFNGDGNDDLVLYRAGASSGDQSNWYYRTTPGGTVFNVPWGINGDFPVTGDFDGDNKNDFVVQRNAGGGQARFWMLLSGGGTNQIVFGTPTDRIVPGDYDGDGITDLTVIRGQGGSIYWYVRSSSTTAISVRIWGLSATDFPTQGDYDGDGQTDVGIWRPSASPSASAFWVQQSSNGQTLFTLFGSNGDYPVATYDSH